MIPPFQKQKLSFQERVNPAFLNYLILKNSNFDISNSPMLGCQDIGIRKSEFLAEAHVL